MIYDRVLIRYGDLTLKGKNQKVFLDSLHKLIRLKLKDLNIKIEKAFNRLYIVLNDENYQDVIHNLKYVSGIKSFSLVVKCDNDLDQIIHHAIALIKAEIITKKTFKVEAKRADKRFPINSQELVKVLASGILSKVHNLIVDVHHPEVTLKVEVRDEGSFIYLNEIEALGGFPVGVAGKGLLMMSGGIDSPVAGFLSMKQGVEIEVIHFESTPLTSIESAQKVIDLCQKLAFYSPNNSIKIHMVPFRELHQAILENVYESYHITIMRRMMYKIASSLANNLKIKVLINGESIGQVASQTLDSMYVINEVTKLPVIRPLATMDKNDIIKIAIEIDTYQLSIKPFMDCCTIYVPKSPVIYPKLPMCYAIEKKVNFDDLVSKCVNNVNSIIVTTTDKIDLTILGFEVNKILKEKENGEKENK